jgi:hypothetical protein
MVTSQGEGSHCPGLIAESIRTAGPIESGYSNANETKIPAMRREDMLAI